MNNEISIVIPGSISAVLYWLLVKIAAGPLLSYPSNGPETELNTRTADSKVFQNFDANLFLLEKTSIKLSFIFHRLVASLLAAARSFLWMFDFSKYAL